MNNSSSHQITKASGSNLALSFFSLPPEKRRAMSSFYAFCRLVDDIADSTVLPLEEKKRQLGEWREELRLAYTGRPATELGKELAEIIRAYLIPPTPLEEIINGVEMDLSIDRYPDFPSLEQYCYRVASAVGLVSIEIFCYRQKQTRDYAVALGMAFQLTNILRDVKKDASFGRIYLPLDELKTWGVTEDDILRNRWSPQMQQLLRFQYHRARHYFAKADRLIHPEDRANLVAAEIMREVYGSVLEKIRAHDFNVFDKPCGLTKPEKIYRIWKARRRSQRPLPVRATPQKVLVLGAGFAGLTAAVELSRRGHAVTVLESKALLGGRAHSFPDPATGEIIDNGQHIFMGCYPESLALLDLLGVRGRLHSPPSLQVPYLDEAGRHFLEAAPLPAPLHLLAALLRFSALQWKDRWAAIRLMTLLRLGAKPSPSETVETWLHRWNQTPGVIRAVWEPLCLAALNEPSITASAALFAEVVKRALLGSRSQSTILLSKVGLSDLFAVEAERLIGMCGGKILRHQPVQRLHFSGDRIESVETTKGEIFSADHIVSALPWNALRMLLPESSPLKHRCHALKDAPILNLLLWLDRPVLREPFVGFLDSPVHWVFSREQVTGTATPGRHSYALVMSGAYALLDKNTAEIEALALAELRRFLPEAREARVLHRFLYKARSATFATTPEAEPLRPNPVTHWKNFWLAGDWTNTGLPATLEGAVLSGNRAAGCVDQSA
jgi:squalene synthase HpnD